MGNASPAAHELWGFSKGLSAMRWHNQNCPGRGTQILFVWRTKFQWARVDAVTYCEASFCSFETFDS